MRRVLSFTRKLRHAKCAPTHTHAHAHAHLQATPRVDTGAAERPSIASIASIAGDIKGHERNKEWKQPILPKPPLKLIKGMGKLANNEPPEGIFN